MKIWREYMNRTLLVNIGIPAYNEMQNIGKLLESLQSQNFQEFKINNILVVSDGSTDDTDRIVKKFKNKKIKLISDKKRNGVAIRLNQIIKLTDTDILVILNADILPKDSNFIDHLVKPIIHYNADLTSAAIRPVTPTKWFEKIVGVGEKIKTSFFEDYLKGNNFYTCRGTARAFSKRFYKKIVFPNKIGDDSYSYLYCVSNNYKYFFADQAIIYFKLPDSYKDFKKQIVRFLKIKENFSLVFGTKQINKNLYFSKFKFIKKTFSYFLHDIMGTVLYSMLYTYVRIDSLFARSDSSGAWETSKSTKLLNNLYETK